MCLRRTTDDGGYRGGGREGKGEEEGGRRVRKGHRQTRDIAVSNTWLNQGHKTTESNRCVSV